MPISADAASDCSRRRRVSSVMTGDTNTGELGTLETSVGGVEGRETRESDR